MNCAAPSLVATGGESGNVSLLQAMLLQQLAEAGVVLACYQDATGEGISLRKAACVEARCYLNRQDNNYSHTVLVEFYGKVVKTIVQEHEAAPFEPTTHAEGIVKYSLKKCGSNGAMPTSGFTLQVFTRFGRGEERSNEAH